MPDPRWTIDRHRCTECSPVSHARCVLRAGHDIRHAGPGGWGRWRERWGGGSEYFDDVAGWRAEDDDA